MIQKHLFIIAIFLVLSIGVTAALVFMREFSIPSAGAFNSSDEVHGWAWSSTIGWIGFNCAEAGVCGATNYKVRMNLATGVFSGYGWSSNIGWVNFAPAGPYPAAPNHGVQVDMNTGVVTGWARALANGDGWDGWIKITDAKIVQGGAIKNGTGTEGGWAWGSFVVGWVNFANPFAGVTVPHVDCDFSMSPSSIIPPQTATLSWSCNSLAKACSIDQGVGSSLGIMGTKVVRPTKQTAYTLTCQGFGGPFVDTKTVGVSTQVRIKEVGPGQ